MTEKLTPAFGDGQRLASGRHRIQQLQAAGLEFTGRFAAWRRSVRHCGRLPISLDRSLR